METPVNEKISKKHLEKRAIVYLRQSSISQVKNNIESQRLQYALSERATQLGFKQVDIIDKDLGASAATGSRQRPGFQELLTRVAVGDVGIILSRELSRLSRTDKNWCHLMEICQLFDTLIGDDETIYDPQRFDDQLVLGIKGTMSVAELGVLKMRLIQGKLAKARRGALFTTVAPGYIKEGDSIVKDPDRRVQDAIMLVFKQFKMLGSIRQVHQWFIENKVELPTNKAVDGKFQLVWKLPALTFIPSLLHNPIYAGAYVYGRRPTQKILEGGEIKKSQHAIISPEEAKVFIKDNHEPYISWSSYLRNKKMIENNGTNFQADATILAAREGQGLLTGLLRCARCGHKLHVRYWGKKGTTPRYVCNGDYHNGGQYCIGFSGTTAEKQITKEILKIISPKGVAASLEAITQLNTRHDHRQQALERQLEQADYEANRAFTQYDQVDPNNRLVADTLEQRLDQKLQYVEQIRNELNASQSEKQSLSRKEEESLLDLGQHFIDVWEHPSSSMSIKKKIVRLLIKEIIVDTNETEQTLSLIVHWKGGVHTKLSVARPLPANKAHKTSDRDLEIIRKMAIRYDDTEIAKVLSKLGRKTGKGNRWTKSSVGTARRKLKIKAPSKNEDDDTLNMVQAKKYCGVSDSTLLKLIEENILPAQQIVTFAPFEIKRSDLDSEPVYGIIKNLKKTGRLELKGSQPTAQKELFI